MQSGNRLRPPSRLVTRALLLLALTAATLALTHCQMVGDRLNGVGVGTFKRKDDCLAKCQADFQACNKAEDTRHQQALATCGSNGACITNENALYDTNKKACKAARDACQNNCHNQGGGSSGP